MGHFSMAELMAPRLPAQFTPSPTAPVALELKGGDALHNCFANWNMAIEIVDLPIKNGDFP